MIGAFLKFGGHFIILLSLKVSELILIDTIEVGIGQVGTRSCLY